MACKEHHPLRHLALAFLFVSLVCSCQGPPPDAELANPAALERVEVAVPHREYEELGIQEVLLESGITASVFLKQSNFNRVLIDAEDQLRMRLAVFDPQEDAAGIRQLVSDLDAIVELSVRRIRNAHGGTSIGPAWLECIERLRASRNEIAAMVWPWAALLPTLPYAELLPEVRSGLPKSTYEALNNAGRYHHSAVSKLSGSLLARSDDSNSSLAKNDWRAMIVELDLTYRCTQDELATLPSHAGAGWEQTVVGINGAHRDFLDLLERGLEAADELPTTKYERLQGFQVSLSRSEYEEMSNPGRFAMSAMDAMQDLSTIGDEFPDGVDSIQKKRAWIVSRIDEIAEGFIQQAASLARDSLEWNKAIEAIEGFRDELAAPFLP